MSTERFAPLAPETMTADQIRVAQAIAAGPRGNLRGPFKALLSSPELADRVQRLGEYARFRSSVPPRLNELAILLVSRKWTAQFEFSVHAKLAEKAGLDPAVIAAIAEGRQPKNMPEQERAVHAFCTELLETTQVSDGTFQAVNDRFGANGVIDLIGTLGYYTLVSMVLNVDRYALPEGVVPPLKPLPLTGAARSRR